MMSWWPLTSEKILIVPPLTSGERCAKFERRCFWDIILTSGMDRPTPWTHKAFFGEGIGSSKRQDLILTVWSSRRKRKRKICFMNIFEWTPEIKHMGQKSSIMSHLSRTRSYICLLSHGSEKCYPWLLFVSFMPLYITVAFIYICRKLN